MFQATPSPAISSVIRRAWWLRYTTFAPASEQAGAPRATLWAAAFAADAPPVAAKSILPASAYGVDAVSCAAMAVAAWRMAPQPPHGVEAHPPIRRSIAEGLRFVVSNRALLGSA